MMLNVNFLSFVTDCESATGATQVRAFMDDLQRQAGVK
jgi:hypothetical protein